MLVMLGVAEEAEKSYCSDYIHQNGYMGKQRNIGTMRYNRKSSNQIKERDA